MIVYFSGTGNTRYCARQLSELTGDTCIELTAAQLRQPSCATLQTADSRIITMFPTYSWGVPPVFMRFLREARIDCPAGTQAWMVTTCGDDIGLAALQWRRAVRRAGMVPCGAFSVQMPNTYVCMKGFDTDSAQVEQSKLSAAGPRLQHIADAIIGGKTDTVDVVTGSFAWFKTNVIRPWFDRFCMSPKPFHATDACTSCGLCIRSCPMKNMTAGVSGRPEWGNRCALCLRCYHICPQHAVQYGRQTADKGQYRHFLYSQSVRKK